MTAKVEELLERHAAFWRRDKVDRPLIRLQPLRERPRLENTEVTPDMLDVDAFTPQIGKRDLRKHLIQGDLFHCESAFPAIPWMEAIIGCEIHAGANEAMWAKPALGPNFEGLENIIPDDSNPWLGKLLALTQALVEANDGSYLVTHTLMRGPIDMLSALLGDERMGLSFYDAPAQVQEILTRTTEAFIKVAKAQYAIIPPFHGGYAPWLYSIWAPGKVIRLQSDSASQLSPRMYQEQILPHDRKIMSSFDYAILDLHSAGTLHLHQVLLKVEELDALSITLDRYENAPTVQELIPIFAAILKAKSLLIYGEMTPQEVELLKSSLPAAGLAINALVTEKLLWQRAI
ncbi:MAG: hypothetical protein J7M05_10285 [Anaerolineae bacterium]|nr:hypothetical protein [Anaerolineae bacterium]